MHKEIALITTEAKLRCVCIYYMYVIYIYKVYISVVYIPLALPTLSAGLHKFDFKFVYYTLTPSLSPPPTHMHI